MKNKTVYDSENREMMPPVQLESCGMEMIGNVKKIRDVRAYPGSVSVVSPASVSCESCINRILRIA